MIKNPKAAVSIAYHTVKIINWAVLAFIIFACAVLAYLYICNLIGMPVPRLGPIRMYIVLSDSMSPVFVENDAILNIEAKPEKIRPGDIITYKAFDSDTVITHRVVSAEFRDGGRVYRTKGDSNNVEDRYDTLHSQVIGKYFLRLPKVGYWLNQVREKPYLTLLAAVFVICLQILLGSAEKGLKFLKQKAGEKIE